MGGMVYAMFFIIHFLWETGFHLRFLDIRKYVQFVYDEDEESNSYDMW